METILTTIDSLDFGDIFYFKNGKYPYIFEGRGFLSKGGKFGYKKPNSDKIIFTDNNSMVLVQRKIRIENKPRYCSAWTSNISDKPMCNTIPCCGFCNHGKTDFVSKGFKDTDKVGSNQAPTFNDMRLGEWYSRPIQVEDGEWLYKGNFIQKQDHPELLKYCVFSAKDDRRHIGVSNTWKGAKELCKDNQENYPDVNPNDFLKITP